MERKRNFKKKFYFAKQMDVTTNTQIARNHGRLPEKGFRPSKLATYCITQQNTKNASVQMCKNVQKISDGHKIRSITRQ